MIPNGVILALLLSVFRGGIYAEDQAAKSTVVEPRLDKNLTLNEDPTESDTRRHRIPMVGPSAEEMHDFLYPTPKDSEVVTSAN